MNLEFKKKRLEEIAAKKIDRKKWEEKIRQKRSRFIKGVTKKRINNPEQTIGGQIQIT